MGEGCFEEDDRNIHMHSQRYQFTQGENERISHIAKVEDFLWEILEIHPLSLHVHGSS